MIDDRSYIVLPVSELRYINFEEVIETSRDTVRLNKDGLKTFVKWNGTSMPTSLINISGLEGPYTHREMIEILSKSEWQEEAL